MSSVWQPNNARSGFRWNNRIGNKVALQIANIGKTQGFFELGLAFLQQGLAASAADCNRGNVGGNFGEPDMVRFGESRLTVIHGESSNDMPLRSKNWCGPAGAQPVL